MMRYNCRRRHAAVAATATIGLGQAQLLDEDDDLAYDKPWPTYSLQNMPKTQFTCHDKILGGYYADPETQCQMFHVCVKLPGVGLIHRRVNSFVQQVQDYRFLCPNTTAFDQELQICANWADVDCDKAVSFYDINNNLNDLYRSGNGVGVPDESKSANEDEATFHLQRAESGDVRRSKENRGEQKSRPRHNYVQPTDSHGTQTTKRPISSYYTPTTSSSSTTSTTTTTERSYYSNNNNNNNNDDSKQDFDDIFKGSHSSHFFSNRHGGREFDDEPSQPARPKANDFNDYNRKTTESSNKSRATPTRGQRITSPSTTPPAPTTTTTTKSLKKITLHAAYNTDFIDYSQHYRSTTAASSGPSSTVTTPRPSSSITSRFSFGVNDYQTQERIQPTTYNPNNGAYRFKSTDLPSPSTSTKLTGKNAQDFDKDTTKRHKPTVAARKQQKLGPQESNYINHNEFAEVPKVKLQQPQPFQATQRKPVEQQEPHYQRSRTQQLTRVGNQEPAPFKASAKPNTAASAKPRSFTSRGSITYKATTQHYADDVDFYYPTTTTTAATNNPYFVSGKKHTSPAGKDLFTPTTFKPTTYKKPYDQSYYQQAQQTLRPNQGQTKKNSAVTSAPATTPNPNNNIDEDDGQYHPELYENDFPRNRIKFLRNRSTSSTTSTTTTAAPVSIRQPQGFNHHHNFQQAHSHLKTQQHSTYQKEREQADDSDDEDELFKTAQSLNFGAASINKLRADIYKAEKTSQQYNSQYSPQAAPSSQKTTASIQTQSTAYLTSTSTTTRRPTTSTTTTTKPTTTTAIPSGDSKKSSGKSKKEQHQEKKTKSSGKRPPHVDEDTSYDYAYYDTD
ncbi:uncharacterized protein [Drosophila tropicalis]|uniref:uncharacterized protein n=1 Tax=Drosophila tropicalis TaxID=46794 RepID=UPI0035AB9C83